MGRKATHPASKVVCPRCASPEGKLCRSSSGKVSGPYHAERRALVHDATAHACPCGGGELHYLCAK